MKSHLLILVILVTACGGTARGPGAAAGHDSAEARPTGMADMPGMGPSGSAGASDSAPIRITSRQASLAGITFAVAREAPVERTVRAVAMVTPDERTLGIVNARVSGWVEKLYANETGALVQTGDALLDLYSPDLVTAQEEYLLAKRLAATAGGDSLVAAARRRLTLWNISDQEIATLDEAGMAMRTLTIRSPYPGHILEKNVIEGQMVRAGDRLFQIADLSTVWIEPAIFEQDIALVHEGQRAQVTFDALPGRTFDGRVTFVYPQLDMRTRTLKVRIEVHNPRYEIKPMMYGTVRIHANGPRGVLVPLTAVLPTGRRDLAFVVRQGGVVPTAVTVGARGDSSVVIVQGVSPGDTVVASATFLFDSESSLAAAMQGIMLNMGMGLDMGGMRSGKDMKDAKGDSGMAGMQMPGKQP